MDINAGVDSEAREGRGPIGKPHLEAESDGEGDGGVLGAFEQRFANLESIADSALGYMSLEEMLSELLERIRTALDVDTTALLLMDEDRRVLVARAARGLEEEVRQGVQVPLARGFAGRVAAQAEPIIIEDLERAEVVNPILRQKGIRSMLGVPVHVEGHVIGVLHIGTLQRRDFDDSDVSLLQHAADRAALSIDNARLSEQRAVTEIMQHTLLPMRCRVYPGCASALSICPPARGSRSVGTGMTCSSSRAGTWPS